MQVGPELPEPSVVSWDPTLRYLALAYLRQVQVLRAQPTLEVLGSLPIVGTTAAVWGIRQLYLATPTSILLAFVAAEEAQQQQQQQAAAGGWFDCVMWQYVAAVVFFASVCLCASVFVAAWCPS